MNILLRGNFEGNFKVMFGFGKRIEGNGRMRKKKKKKIKVNKVEGKYVGKKEKRKKIKNVY